MNIKKIMYEQLASDLGCSSNDIENDKNIFVFSKKLESARICNWHNISKLNLICINNKIVARSEDNNLIQWLIENYSNFNGAWLSEYYSSRQLDEGLKQFGICIGNFQPFFIPHENKILPNFELLNDLEIEWYDQKEILKFEGDKRFKEAIIFDKGAPDMIAVTAKKDGEIIAMSGANADSKTMWQMGISVIPNYKSQGIGTAMVTLLKNKIMDTGILPYYGTAMSHIKSQKTAIKAGFIPAWSELCTMSFEK
jgi:hypothetical protein